MITSGNTTRKLIAYLSSKGIVPTIPIEDFVEKILDAFDEYWCDRYAHIEFEYGKYEAEKFKAAHKWIIEFGDYYDDGNTYDEDSDEFWAAVIDFVETDDINSLYEFDE